MHPAFERTGHRPWPHPARPWVMRQSWLDLLFAHWPVPASILQPLVPRQLLVQEFDGVSWVGVVPFRMEGVTPRGFPSLPWLSAFPELNLRLYVEPRDGGKPGVWFLSLDAGNPVAVWAARRFFHLPYFRAEMRLDDDGSEIRYASRRRADGTAFQGRYRPIGDVSEAKPGSIEHWLTERYCLYAQAPNGSLFRGEIQHQPWPLQPAEAEIEVNDLASPHGFTLDGPPALLHFARRLDVVVWGLEPIAYSAASSFSWIPSKPPLLNTMITSPSVASILRRSTIALLSAS